MRIIKFRAWNEDLKRMAYSTDEHFKTPGWWGVILLDKEELGEKIMQFTGLLDKNGKEIYEGDIVNYTKHPAGKAVVEWNPRAYFELVFPSGNKNFIPEENLFEIYGFEIIGNIYSNPELLAK